MKKESEIRITNPRLLRWLTRVLSLLYILFVIFALPCLINSECPEGPPPENWPTGWSLIVFPFGVCLAFIIGWFKQLTGGLIALTCIITAWILPSIPLKPGLSFVFLSMVSILFVTYGWYNLFKKN